MATTIGAMVGFVLWHVRAELATIQRRLFGVVVCQRDRGLVVSDAVVGAALLALGHYETELAEQGVRRGRGSAPARDLRRLCANVPEGLVGVRD